MVLSISLIMMYLFPEKEWAVCGVWNDREVSENIINWKQ